MAREVIRAMRRFEAAGARGFNENGPLKSATSLDPQESLPGPGWRYAMHVSEAVVNFLNRNPGRFFCDPCIQAGCLLGEPAEVAYVTSALAMTPDFLQMTASCTMCARMDCRVTRSA